MNDTLVKKDLLYEAINEVRNNSESDLKKLFCDEIESYLQKNSEIMVGFLESYLEQGKILKENNTYPIERLYDRYLLKTDYDENEITDFLDVNLDNFVLEQVKIKPHIELYPADEGELIYCKITGKPLAQYEEVYYNEPSNIHYSKQAFEETYSTLTEQDVEQGLFFTTIDYEGKVEEKAAPFALDSKDTEQQRNTERRKQMAYRHQMER